MSFDTGHEIVTALTARLSGQSTALGLTSVRASLDGLPDRIGLPLAAVLPLRETAAEPVSRRAGVARVTTRIGVLIAVPVRNDRGGAKARLTLTPILQGLRAALAGWCPPGAAEALIWREGRLMDLQATHALWQDSWDAVWWYGGET